VHTAPNRRDVFIGSSSLTDGETIMKHEPNVSVEITYSAHQDRVIQIQNCLADLILSTG
jgi:hypothetical protein